MLPGEAQFCDPSNNGLLEVVKLAVDVSDASLLASLNSPWCLAFYDLQAMARVTVECGSGLTGK